MLLPLQNFALGQGAELAATVRKVLSYLATFEDLHEDTAARLLTDTILLEGLKRYEEGAPEFSVAIEKAIFAHNEVLVRERDELLVEREEQLGMAQRALRDAAAGKDPLASLEDLVRSLKENVQRPLTIHNHDGGIVNTDSGGNYYNDRSQVGAQGPGAHANVNDQTVQFTQLSVDPELIRELVEVKNRLLASAASSADFETIASTQGAIEALEENDERKAGGFLRRAGQKALDTALEIGAKLASAALESQLGIGS